MSSAPLIRAEGGCQALEAEPVPAPRLKRWLMVIGAGALALTTVVGSPFWLGVMHSGAEDANILMLKQPKASQALREEFPVSARPLEEIQLLKLPPCKQRNRLSQLATLAGQWCDPHMVPAAQRAPAKLQGLFWLNGLPLADVAACLSRGIWDQEKRTLRVNVWSDFVYKDIAAGVIFESEIYNADMHYLFQFHDSDLSNASVHPQGSGLYSINMKAFDIVSEFPLIEAKGLKVPGDRWDRPSYFGLGNFKVKTNDYSLWRIMDGNLQVNVPNTNSMLRDLGHDLGVVHYSTDCLSPANCSRDTGGSCNLLKCHSWRGPTDCIKTGFLWRCICPEGHCAVNGKCITVVG